VPDSAGMATVRAGAVGEVSVSSVSFLDPGRDAISLIELHDQCLRGC